MNCPNCKTPLTQETHREINLDSCKSCGCIWFDRGKLDRYRETSPAISFTPHKGEFFAATGVLPQLCPRCSTSTLQMGCVGVHSFSQCSGCKGVFAKVDEKTTFELLLQVLWPWMIPNPF